MNIQEKETAVLDQLLAETDYTQLDQYLERHTVEFEKDAFATYISAYVQQHGLKKREVIDRAGLNEAYGYKLMNGTKQPANRDKVIGLCIAAGMDERHVNRALKMTKNSPLYSKDSRDAVILVGIHHGVKSVMELNEYLLDYKMEILNLTE